MLDRLDRFGAAVLLALIICVPAYFLLAKKRGFKYRKQLFGTRKIDGMRSEIPFEGNLLPAYFILSNQERVSQDSRYGELTVAYFFHWILEGRIQIIESAPGEPYPVYLFPEKDSPKNAVEKKLFNSIRTGAGSNRTLTRYKAYKWGRHHATINADLFTEQVHLWLEDHNYVAKKTLINVYLNPEGAAEARKAVELENYLNALMAGEAVEAPDPAKLPYFIEFAILMRKFPEFLKTLEQYPDSCAPLAGILGCDKENVIGSLHEARLTMDAILKGIDDETDDVIEQNS